MVIRASLSRGQATETGLHLKETRFHAKNVQNGVNTDPGGRGRHLEESLGSTLAFDGEGAEKAPPGNRQQAGTAPC